MEFTKILELLALLKKKFGLSDIEFISDSGEGDDDDKLTVIVPQTGMIHFYPTCFYLFQFSKPTKKMSYEGEANHLFSQVTDYFRFN